MKAVQCTEMQILLYRSRRQSTTLLTSMHSPLLYKLIKTADH